MEVAIDGKSLTIEDVIAVARDHAKVVIPKETEKRVRECRKVVEELIQTGKPIYGVTTGIGEFAKINISPEQVEQLQRNIVCSHAAGTGDPFPQETVRAAMLLRANMLAKGHSGIRFEVFQTYVEMINRNVVPYVHEKGSIGTSGDLSPLSQLAEVVMGEGRAWYGGELLPGGDAMERAGLKTWTLKAKEGLALINGTQMFVGGGCLALHDAYKLLKTAQIASAVTFNALFTPLTAFDPRVHALRPYPGQNAVAANIRKLCEKSEILSQQNPKVQDAYSLRCTPQILGASRDALDWVRQQIEIEINSGVDNPLFFPEDRENVPAGNFHGQPIAIALDLLAIAVSEIANLSERHTNRLLNPTLSKLPDFLTEKRGLNSGMMVSQYTAAALVSENKVLSHPASVDSISVSGDQEDHNSMGPISARKAREIVKNVGAVLAIELMCGCQALEFRKPLKPSRAAEIAYNRIREVVPRLEDDRVLYPDINAIADLVRDNTLLNAVESEIGPLQ